MSTSVDEQDRIELSPWRRIIPHHNVMGIINFLIRHGGPIYYFYLYGDYGIRIHTAEVQAQYSNQLKLNPLS